MSIRASILSLALTACGTGGGAAAPAPANAPPVPPAVAAPAAPAVDRSDATSVARAFVGAIESGDRTAASALAYPGVTDGLDDASARRHASAIRAALTSGAVARVELLPALPPGATGEAATIAAMGFDAGARLSYLEPASGSAHELMMLRRNGGWVVFGFDADAPHGAPPAATSAAHATDSVPSIASAPSAALDRADATVVARAFAAALENGDQATASALVPADLGFEGNFVAGMSPRGTAIREALAAGVSPAVHPIPANMQGEAAGLRAMGFDSVADMAYLDPTSGQPRELTLMRRQSAWYVADFD